MVFCKLFRVLNTVLRGFSGNSRDGACLKLDTEDNFSKSARQNFVIFGKIFTFIVF